jgi:hypothetical protein
MHASKDLMWREIWKIWQNFWHLNGTFEWTKRTLGTANGNFDTLLLYLQLSRSVKKVAMVKLKHHAHAANPVFQSKPCQMPNTVWKVSVWCVPTDYWMKRQKRANHCLPRGTPPNMRRNKRIWRRLCLLPQKKILCKKKDSPSHQTYDTCMEY